MEDDFAVNLRRLLFFHHASAREAAAALGVNEHTVSAWLTGKRRPRMDFLVLLAQLYDVDVRDLMGDQLDFAQRLGDRARIIQVEQHNMGRVRPDGTVVQFRKPRKTGEGSEPA